MLCQDLHGDHIWHIWKQVQRGSDFPKATLLLYPSLLPTSPLVSTTQGPVCLRHSLVARPPPGDQGQRLWPTRTLEVITSEWVGKRPREGNELPKVTQQNETWAKGSCFSTLIISLESHRIWVALHSERTLAAPTGPRAIQRNLGSPGTRNQASSPTCCVTSCKPHPSLSPLFFISAMGIRIPRLPTRQGYYEVHMQC